MANKVYPLKKSASYRNVAAKGFRKKLSNWLFIQLIASVDSKNYFGVTVSRKVGNAVIRNKLKRWVKNCVRTEAWPRSYEAHTIVCVFKQQASDEFYKDLEYKEFLRVFSSLREKNSKT